VALLVNSSLRSPVLAAELVDVKTYLEGASGYARTADEIGTGTTTDFIRHTALFNALLAKIGGALRGGATEVSEAPLAVVGSPPQSGLFAFDKFSSAPFVMAHPRDGARSPLPFSGHGCRCRWSEPGSQYVEHGAGH
jgi:hypothetical protein